MKQRKWKWLACCIALIGMVFMMPKMSVQAEETQAEETQVDKNTITLKPIAYNIGEDIVRMRLSTNATDLTLAYYLDQRGSGYTYDEMFELATKTNTAETEFSVTDAITGEIFVWLIDKNGNRLSDTYDYFNYIWSTEDVLLNYINPEIIFENGEILDLYNPEIVINKGKVSYAKTAGYDTKIHFYFQNLKNCPLYDMSRLDDGTNAKVEVDCAPIIEESGVYEIRAMIKDKGTCSRPQVVFYEYVKPEEKVSAIEASSIKIKNGIVTYQAAIEGVDSYRCRLYSSDDGVNFRTVVTYYESFGMTDFSDWLEEGKVYKVGVRANSNDIEAYAHSDEVFSEIYDPSKESEEVEDVLKDILEQAGVDSVEQADADTLLNIYNQASEEDKTKIAQALKDGLCDLDKNQLKIAMQTNSATRDTVSAIEKMSGVTVKTDNISEEAKEFLEAGGVQMVGAGLNAADGVNEVSLEITKADAGNMDESHYKKYIPLEITLNGVENVKDLAVPVQITMPIPKGVSPSKIMILHMNADGTVGEKLTIGNGLSYDNSNRTITFTVTHFSTFVFAEEVDDADKPDGGNPDKPGDGNTNKPDDGNTDKPIDGNTDKPDGGNPDKPNNGNTNKPDGGDVDKPVSGQNQGNANDTNGNTNMQGTVTVDNGNKNAENTKNVASPKTGDTNAMFALGGILLVIGSCIVGIIYKKWRKEARE